MIISQRGSAIRITLHVKPKASRSKILGPKNGALEIAVAAPPVDGAANDEVCTVLAKALGAAGRDVSIVAGASSRSKVVEVLGFALADACAKLGIEPDGG